MGYVRYFWRVNKNLFFFAVWSQNAIFCSIDSWLVKTHLCGSNSYGFSLHLQAIKSTAQRAIFRRDHKSNLRISLGFSGFRQLKKTSLSFLINTYLMKHGSTTAGRWPFWSILFSCPKVWFWGDGSRNHGWSFIEALNDCQFYAIINLGTRFLDDTFEKWSPLNFILYIYI